MVDTLIPISGPGSSGQSQPGLSFPSLPTSLPCWVYQVIGGVSGSMPVNCTDITAPVNGQHPAPGPGQGVAAGAQGAASAAQGAASAAAGGWKSLQDIGSWLSNGAHWKGLALVGGAVALAGVGLMILVSGNKDTRQAAVTAAKAAAE